MSKYTPKFQINDIVLFKKDSSFVYPEMIRCIAKVIAYQDYNFGEETYTHYKVDVIKMILCDLGDKYYPSSWFSPRCEIYDKTSIKLTHSSIDTVKLLYGI